MFRFLFSPRKLYQLLQWYLNEYLPWYQRQQRRKNGVIEPLALGTEDPPPPPPWIP